VPDAAAKEDPETCRAENHGKEQEAQLEARELKKKGCATLL
jgi:hypothetical protein